jgi:hypothetical protein
MTASCALIVNPDLEGLEAYPADAGASDAHTGDEPTGSGVGAETGDVRDADARADDSPDADAAPDGPEAGDTGVAPTSDGGEGGVLVTGSFVASSVMTAPTSQYQVVGQIVSTPRVRGSTTSGFLVEGWLQ